MRLGLARFRMTIAALCAVGVALLGVQAACAGVDATAHSLGMEDATHVCIASAHYDAPDAEPDAKIHGKTAAHHHDVPSAAWIVAAGPAVAVFGDQRLERASPQQRLTGLQQAPPDHPPKPNLDFIA